MSLVDVKIERLRERVDVLEDLVRELLNLRFELCAGPDDEAVCPICHETRTAGDMVWAANLETGEIDGPTCAECAGR